MSKKKHNTEAPRVGIYIKIGCRGEPTIQYPVLYTMSFSNGTRWYVSEIDFGYSQNINFALNHNRLDYIAGSKDYAHCFKFESDADIWRSLDDFFDLR